MQPTYLLGDHHGGYDDLLSRILRKGIRHARIIHVGDGEEGFPWWETDTPQKLNQVFSEFDTEYISMELWQPTN